jgi:hypothetical protein
VLVHHRFVDPLVGEHVLARRVVDVERRVGDHRRQVFVADGPDDAGLGADADRPEVERRVRADDAVHVTTGAAALGDRRAILQQARSGLDRVRGRSGFGRRRAPARRRVLAFTGDLTFAADLTFTAWAAALAGAARLAGAFFFTALFFGADAAPFPAFFTCVSPANPAV